MKPLDQFPPVRRGEEKRQTWCRDCFAEANARNYRKNHEREKARIMAQVSARRAEVRGKIVEYLRAHPCVDCGETDIVVLEFDHLGEKVANVSTYANGGRTWERVLGEIGKCQVVCANCHRRRTRSRAATTSEAQPTPAIVRKAGRPHQLTIDDLVELRRCRVCGVTKPLIDFPLRSAARRTRHEICLSCQREVTRNWYTANREKQIASARKRRAREARILARQIRGYLLSHPCVDCGESDPAVLDFDHLRDKRADVSALVHGAASWDLILAEIAKCEVRCSNCHRRRTAKTFGYYRALEATI